MTLWIATFVCGLLGAIAQIITHIWFWPAERRLKRTEAYQVGLAIIGVAWTIWCGWTRFDIGLAWWPIAGMSGLAVLSAYWVRGWLARRDQRLREESYRAGQAQAAVAAAREDEHGAHAPQSRD